MNGLERLASPRSVRLLRAWLALDAFILLVWLFSIVFGDESNPWRVYKAVAFALYPWLSWTSHLSPYLRLRRLESAPDLRSTSQ